MTPISSTLVSPGMDVDCVVSEMESTVSFSYDVHSVCVIVYVTEK